MNRNSGDSSPTAELWLRLAGMFGADTLERKFGRDIPAEWRGIVDRMPRVELDRGMRRLVYGGKGHVPTLPEFVKLCKAVGDDQEFGGPKQATPLLAGPPPVTDNWGAAANMHLMAEAYRNPRRFASPDCAAITAVLVRWKNEWARLMREGDPADHDPGAQKQLWRACMSQAEVEIDDLRAVAA
ncbi:MAG: hypothetical protein IT178_16485 [Acidobacteria bacterium]|nr:hypothetical protein [Acidobacteriota bacterium]